MDGIEAAYHFAGVLGMSPAGQTLRSLWRMACGRLKQKRNETVELAVMVWAMGDYDIESYLAFGSLDETGRGKPVKLEPELEARVDAEVEKIRRESEGLPKVKAVN